MQHVGRKLGIRERDPPEPDEIGQTAPDGVLTLADSKGRRVLVPVAKLAYVEIGTTTSGHVGYRT